MVRVWYKKLQEIDQEHKGQSCGICGTEATYTMELREHLCSQDIEEVCWGDLKKIPVCDKCYKKHQAYEED